MARIAGVNIPKNKRFVIALTYIYGIGSTRANKICEKLKVDLSKRTQDLPEDVIIKAREIVENDYPLLEGNLRRKVTSDVKRLIDIGCYKGIRHVKKLPTRGQRTSTNARTRKGKGVAIAGKKKATK